jgi:O-antigen biosynthesis protein WbqP
MRLLDIIISITALIFLFPIFLLVAVIIFMNDFKSPFFLQLRKGKGGCFKIIKFRTMSTDPEVTLRNVTSVGKYLRILSLDELPQLINVLMGEMSIVGVRPDLCVDKDDYFMQRPGITGIAQINGRSNITELDRNHFNELWEENASIKLYISTIFKTVIYIFSLNFFKDAN